MAYDLDQSLRLDKDTSTVLLGYKQGISPEAELVAPSIRVPGNGKFPQYGKGAFLDQSDDVRAPNQKDVREQIWDTETWTAYVLEEHAKVAFIDRQRKNRSGIVGGMVYSDPMVAAKKLRETMLQRKHYLISYAVNNMGATYYTVPGTKWDATGAVPFDDLQAAIRQFKNNCGMAPTHVLVPGHIMTYLGEAVRASYSVTAAVSNEEIFKKLAMPDLGIPENGLLVDHTPAYDGTNFTSIWEDNVLLFRRAPNPKDFEPTFMATLVPNDKQEVQAYAPYEVPQKTGWEMQVVMDYLVKILDNYAGYMLKTVLT